MLDDFFIRALLAGIGIALVTGPIGCFIIWRRLSFFGDTLSHSALLGVTMAVFFNINISLSVFVISSLIAIMLLRLQKTTKLPPGGGVVWVGPRGWGRWVLTRC